jgi:hypothetical protein
VCVCVWMGGGVEGAAGACFDSSEVLATGVLAKQQGVSTHVDVNWG